MSTKNLAKVAIVAALYVVLTVGLAPLSYGNIQFRVSEVLTLFAFINPMYIPGLVIGCIISNLFSPLGIIDVVVGSFATFISLYCMTKTKNIFVASLFPVIFNGIFVGLELYYLFSLPLLLTMAQVAIGEFVVVSLCGVAMFKVMMSNTALMNTLEIN
ncbi:MAG: QueT transporter family protein [Firmicutes bacterium]|nr:QueT transporter family protein [Bacillota bacterium]